MRHIENMIYALRDSAMGRLRAAETMAQAAGRLSARVCSHKQPQSSECKGPLFRSSCVGGGQVGEGVK